MMSNRRWLVLELHRPESDQLDLCEKFVPAKLSESHLVISTEEMKLYRDIVDSLFVNSTEQIVYRY